MIRWFSLLILAGLAFPPNAYAVNFPQKISLVLKQKASCRDAKRLVRTLKLFVHCSEKSPFARTYEAVYLGHDPLPSVLGEIGTYSKIEAVAPYGELTFSGPVGR